jgi:hypothetical protein
MQHLEERVQCMTPEQQRREATTMEERRLALVVSTVSTLSMAREFLISIGQLDACSDVDIGRAIGIQIRNVVKQSSIEACRVSIRSKKKQRRA